MDKEGYVSLWVGNFKSDEDLQRYLFISYTEDGDSIPSPFEIDFQINYYDEDFMEVNYFDRKINSFLDLLIGCSYDDIVIPNFIKTHGVTLTNNVNSIILLYDFQYSTIEQNDFSDVKYLGNVKYK